MSRAAGSGLRPGDDWCGPPAGSPLLVPGDDGLFGRLAPSGTPLTLTATLRTGTDARWPTAFVAAPRGKRYWNPTFAFERGERVRIELVNAIAEPTIVHWHGLANDTANDGAGFALAAPGARYAYDFTVRERAGLYWYHPHPHGLTAGQAYRGLFGLIVVDDAEGRALRAALDLAWGRTDIPLVLQDRRAGAEYVATAADAHHGLLGDTATVNGGTDPYLDVATRAYRFRILNASNARTYRLGFTDAAGRPSSFTLLGTDGGLLATPIRCTECFVSPAERIDVLVDLSAAAVGDAVVLETRAFDPMHFEPPATGDSAVALHAHAGGGWPEGAPRRLMTLRVRERVVSRTNVPTRLSTMADIDTAGARERAFRLGFAKGRWRINDRVFAMGETPIEVARDAVEVWLLRNYHTSMPHAMHVHGVHFRIVERETSPEFLRPLAVDDRGRLATDLGWKDTVLVWPGESVRVALRFALPYPAAQTYLVHCHNLEHEDGGMMLGVKVGAG
ncbi:MAG: multicopper oxidase domain-containing protein [Betaproteobacteria bacterium]